MKINHLIFPFVSDENYKGAMVFFDIIVDEGWDTLVKLLPHKKYCSAQLGASRYKVLV
jgi:hypothetical protein